MNVIKFTEKPLRSLAAERWDVFVVVDCQWYWNEVDTTQDTNDVEEHSDSTIKNKSDNGTKIQKKRSGGGGGGNDDDVKHQQLNSRTGSNHTLALRVFERMSERKRARE